MKSISRVSIGVVLMAVISGAAYIGVNWLVREETRPTLGALNCLGGGEQDDVARIVCRRKYTWGLDRTLGQAYHAAMAAASGDAAHALEADHAEFVRRRAACFPASMPAELKDVYRCVEDVYRAAIASLETQQPR
jgi:hypothetical protein